MDVKQLIHFITIAEEKNMTKAAQKLFVSQSSLSYSLSKLESELKKALFLRTKSEMVLTPAGQLYLDFAYKVVSIKETLYKNISELTNTTHIHISTTSLWGTRMLAEIMPKYKTAFPQAVFHLSQLYVTQIKNDISNGTLDFGLISVASLDDLDETYELLKKEELFLAVPNTHPYVQTHPYNSITQKELTEQFRNDTFLLSPKYTANRDIVDTTFEEHMPPPHLICEVNGIPLTCEMVSEGIGLSFIPKSGCSYKNDIHYYSLVPTLYRYNVLIYNKSQSNF